MSNVMIDIETLSTRKDAAVLSIGLAAFDDQQVLDTIGLAINPAEVFGQIDVDTIRWWMKQPDAASAYSFNGVMHQGAAWLQLKTFISRHLHATGEVWARGPQFDCVILKSWLEGLQERGIVTQGEKLPWKYNQERDVRTLDGEARRAGVDIPMLYAGTAHNPVDDAANQARMVIAVRRALKAGIAKAHAA